MPDREAVLVVIYHFLDRHHTIPMRDYAVRALHALDTAPPRPRQYYFPRPNEVWPHKGQPRVASMVWYGTVEVCESAPVAVSGWVLTDKWHSLCPQHAHGHCYR